MKQVVTPEYLTVVVERDAALGRAERAEKRVADLEGREAGKGKRRYICTDDWYVDRESISFVERTSRGCDIFLKNTPPSNSIKTRVKFEHMLILLASTNPHCEIDGRTGILTDSPVIWHDKETGLVTHIKEEE